MLICARAHFLQLHALNTYWIQILMCFLFFCLKLKVVAIDENLTVIHQNNVQFDSELPEFR